MKKVHYSGGVVFAEGDRLKGWAVCCTGDRTQQINIDGNHTRDRKEVTCKVCLRLIAKQDLFKEKHPDIWRNMRDKGYCC